MKTMLGAAMLACMLGGLGWGYQLARHPADASPAADGKVAAIAPPGPRVAVAAAARGALEQSFSTYGNLAAAQEVEIAAQVSGLVESIAVQDGDTVAQGQVLFTLDAAVAEADLNAATARLDAASADLQRTQTLVQHGTATPLALEDAQVKLALARTDMTLKQEQRRSYAVTAPFAGQLARMPLTRGALITAGKPVSRIYDQDRLRAEFQVPERLWGRARTGQRFTVKGDGEAGLAADGEVSYISPHADPASRSLVVGGVIDNRDRRLAAGLFVHVRLDLGARQNVILVPEAAIVERLSGSYVFIVETGKSLERRVRLGERRRGRVEVVSGLTEGQHVVVSGQKVIRDNMDVTVAEIADEG
jgi:membrane fusion protein, multidrug efflux system